MNQSELKVLSVKDIKSSNPSQVKALSIKQPWAWAIANGYKDIENRTWQTNFRGPFFIHAGKKFDYNGFNYLKANQRSLRIDHIPMIDDFKLGGIVGSAELVDCLDHYPSPWFHGPYGFLLRRPYPIQFYPCRGKLNFFFFEVDDV